MKNHKEYVVSVYLKQHTWNTYYYYCIAFLNLPAFMSIRIWQRENTWNRTTRLFLLSLWQPPPLSADAPLLAYRCRTIRCAYMWFLALMIKFMTSLPSFFCISDPPTWCVEPWTEQSNWIVSQSASSWGDDDVWPYGFWCYHNIICHINPKKIIISFNQKLLS